ncbi:hypothetical protein ACFQH6_15055 [Halobacteriaceae archaeon GCM10025711]
MASRSTPTPNPGTAGELGARALQGAILFGLILPIVQYFLWKLMVDIPASSDVLSQPPNAWLYISLLGILPPLAFVLTIAFATSEAGIAGGAAYVLMWLVAQQFFASPILTVYIITGLALGLFVYLALKALGSRGHHRRQSGRPPIR